MSVLRGAALSLLAAAAAAALLAAGGATARTGLRSEAGSSVEVVVTLPQPPLAEAILHDRQLASATTTHRRLNVRAPASISYLRTLASAQRSLQARVQAAIPAAEVRWHYGVVVDGVSVVLPRSQLGRLSRVRGATVWPSVTYHALLDRSPQLIGAPQVWGPTLATAGNGIKIGIIDDGVDQTHIFFSPSGFAYPPGFPKGNTSYTTPKVIAAWAFAPPDETWKYARVPFDPVNSDHATNVAGIAAGDNGTLAKLPGHTSVAVSGIAPKAYLGNYKVLTVPTADFGLDGNSPEIVKGIDQAVSDGMNVINLSLGEPEIDPARDIVVAAIDHAADAGVVPVIAAGNDFDPVGRGSIGSPGTAPEAITVAAASQGVDGPADVIADFSSSGPTPRSLQLKPDVTAPGVDILSSLPGNTWSDYDWSGTSMASPHVAGAAAVLLQRHPTWTVAEIKSALESTGDPVHPSGPTGEVSALREGGGRIDLPRADDPLVFTSPTSLSFGLVRRGTTTTQQLAITDAGGGSAPWTVTVAAQQLPRDATITPSAPTVAAGTSLGVTVTVAADAAVGDATGFLTLTRGSDVRRVPFWFHVEVPLLATEPFTSITHPGVYEGDTKGKPARVSSYRYPEGSVECTCRFGIPLDLSGPEQVFQFKLTKPVANFGAAVISRGAGVAVSPRLVIGDDENRLVGYTGLPADINPYGNYAQPGLIVGADLPTPGVYDFVFDTPANRNPGRFTFRFWINDTTPPKIKLLTRRVPLDGKAVFSITDAGAGVDPTSLVVTMHGRRRPVAFERGLLRVGLRGVPKGAQRLEVVASDYQEAKNMENVGPILPNTRTVTTTVIVG